MTSPSKNYTPLVRKLAAEHGVDLAAVNGTGIAGRVTKLDVLAAGAWPSAIAAAVTRGAITPARAPAFEAMAAENPRAMLALLDQIPSGASMVTIGAAGGGSPLPAMTASGMDPKLLTRVPTCARLAIAAAPTLPDAFALMRTYEGMAEAAAMERLMLDPRIQSGWIGESPLVELPPSEAVPTGEATGWFSDAEIGPRAFASYRRGDDEL